MTNDFQQKETNTFMRMERIKKLFLMILMVSIASMIVIYVSGLNEMLDRMESYSRKVDAEKEDWHFQRKVFWSDPQSKDFLTRSEDDIEYYTAHDFDVAYGRAVSAAKIIAPKNETLQKRLPDAIIAGASKCGTRALLEYLSLSRYVVTARWEINFFNTHYDKGLQWYKEQMPQSYSNQITIEKSPDYFECAECPARIYDMKNSTKILILLRDPVERLVSQYMQFKDKVSNTDKQLPPFETWIKEPKTGKIDTRIGSVKISIYADHIKRWLHVFPRNQVLIMDGHKLTKSPFAEIRKVETFLGIPRFITKDDFYFNHTKGFHCMRNRVTGKTHCLGPTKGRRHIRPDNETLAQLYNFYYPHNIRLRDILGYWMTWF